MDIPGIETFHYRESWEPGPGTPIYGDLSRATAFHRQPPALTIGNVDRNAVHYTAAIDLPDGDPGEILAGEDGIRRLLRNAHYGYLVNRKTGGYRRLEDDKWFPGYPLGYSFAFDWLGGVWEINGFDYRPAATNMHNGHTMAYLMLTDLADPGSDLMWASMRNVARHAQTLGARAADRPWPHGKFFTETNVGTPTACCGRALTNQIDAGYGDLSKENDIMQTVNERAYDSRPTHQDAVDDVLAAANSDVPDGQFAAGEMRRIIVGYTNRAQVNITVVGSAPGYVSIAGTPQRPPTSIVNTDSLGGVNANCWTINVPEGAVYVWSSHGNVDVIVDVVERQ